VKPASQSKEEVSTVRQLAVGFTALILTLAPHAKASCIQGEPNRVASVTVTSCSTVAEFAKARLGNVDLPWVVTHVNSVVKRNHGVVISGRVSRKIHLDQYGDDDFRLLDVVAADETRMWFVRGDGMSCDAFQAQSLVEIYATDKCCDVFPPMDVPCLLGLEQAWPVGESLMRFLKSAGFTTR
jgi:hypothetical protein